MMRQEDVQHSPETYLIIGSMVIGGDRTVRCTYVTSLRLEVNKHIITV
jgi:hypothetical protein